MRTVKIELDTPRDEIDAKSVGREGPFIPPAGRSSHRSLFGMSYR